MVFLYVDLSARNGDNMIFCSGLNGPSIKCFVRRLSHNGVVDSVGWFRCL